jgi:hypothetical protein
VVAEATHVGQKITAVRATRPTLPLDVREKSVVWLKISEAGQEALK